MIKFLLGLLLATQAFAANFESFDSSVFIYDSSGHSLSSTSNALNAFLTNSTIACTQSGSWTSGRTWNLNSSTDSVTVVQGTPGPSASPWPVALISPVPLPVSQSGTWTSGRTWTLSSSTDSINAVQSGTWTTGRTWTLASGTDSVSSVQSGTWTVAQGSPNTVANGWPVKVTDGTNTGAVKAASTAAVATDPAQVVAISPDNTVGVTQSTSPWVDNITQIAGNSINTGTGAAGTGTARVSVSNDSKVILWDGTNTQTIKAASTGPAYTDTAIEITQRPDTLGSVTETSISCANTSTTVLAASTATMFIFIRNPTTATNTIWIQINGSAATAAVPSIDLPPGGQAAFFAYGPSYLPTSQINCISGGTTSSIALIYK